MVYYLPLAVVTADGPSTGGDPAQAAECVKRAETYLAQLETIFSNNASEKVGIKGLGFRMLKCKRTCPAQPEAIFSNSASERKGV